MDTDKYTVTQYRQTCMTDGHTHRQTCIHMDKHTCTWTNTHIHRQTHGKADKHTSRYTHGQIHRRTDIQTERKMEKHKRKYSQMDRQKYIQTDIYTDR